ncbi:MAG TPA: hypothetical protein VES38_06690 [Methylotenera sp.]|nr:hypothetical protein [Methylotenera sp.]
MLTTNITAPNPSLNLFTSAELKQGGITVAIDHANLKHEGWGESAYQMLKRFIASFDGKFMCEQVRQFAEDNGLPKAPSSRAWGAIILRASKKDKLIKHVGFGQVTNPKAHHANASMWVRA